MSHFSPIPLVAFRNRLQPAGFFRDVMQQNSRKALGNAMFSNELELESHLRDLIVSKITAREPRIYMLENKKVMDVLICRDEPHPALFFLEVKLFQRHHGRLGIGSAQGRGFQPETVRSKPAYFESHLRWIIADSAQAMPKVLFLPTSTLTQYMAGGSVEEKFNNIQRRIFTEETFLETDALEATMFSWLTET